jgi:hypothetical protein
MPPIAQPNLLPTAQPTMLHVNRPIGIWTSTSPSFNLPAETGKTSNYATDGETIANFPSTAGVDTNDEADADFSTPDNPSDSNEQDEG